MFRPRVSVNHIDPNHHTDRNEGRLIVTTLLDDLKRTIEQQCPNLSVKPKLMRITNVLFSIAEKDSRSIDGVFAVIHFFEHIVALYCDRYIGERDMGQFIVSINISDNDLNTFLNPQEKKKSKKVDEVIKLWGKFRKLIDLDNLKEHNPKIYASYLSYIS
jgi:hypothetical protein